MTQQDVIAQLEAAGWTWQYYGGAQLPVLTNAPVGLILCTTCGEWEHREKSSNLSECDSCYLAYQRSAVRDYRRAKREQNGKADSKRG